MVGDTSSEFTNEQFTDGHLGFQKRFMTSDVKKVSCITLLCINDTNGEWIPLTFVSIC